MNRPTKTESSIPVSRPSRRSFVKSFSLAAGSAFPAIVPSSVFGAAAPSNRVNLAAFGVGGRGTADTDAVNTHPDARFLAVCDCYESAGWRRNRNGTSCMAATTSRCTAILGSPAKDRH
jgi:hypothetical protein